MPALSSSPGQAPTHEERHFSEGKVAAVEPTSAMICCAESTPRPGISANRWTASWCGWSRVASSWSILDDRTIEKISKKDGKTVGTSKSTVSPDGNTLPFVFTDSSASNADPVTGKGESTRVAKGPAGSHAISGSWRVTKLENLSENALLTTFKLEGDTFTMNNPTGPSYTAKLDGTDAPYKG